MAESSARGRVAKGPATDAAPPPPIAPLEETEGGDFVLEAATDEELDDDSALGSDSGSSTASVASSIYEFRKLHGRNYHHEIGNAQYWGTIDDSHSQSLDMIHHAYLLLLNGELYRAPLQNPEKVLDIGCGTGAWAVDMADKFPAAEIIGTDIAPIQPGWVPPNLKFEIEDCTQEWTFTPNDFDYVHMRYLTGSIVDWTSLYKEAFKVLKPGAYLENTEVSPNYVTDDNSMPEDSAHYRWPAIFIQAGERLGRTFLIAEPGMQRKHMEAAGFVDIKEYTYKLPASAWPADPRLKEIGQYIHMAVDSDFDGFILSLTNVLGWTREENDVYTEKMRHEMNSRRIHAYYWNRRIVGRKPDSA